MNARIQELIAQATTAESYYPAGCNGYHEDRYWFDKEKFAQLIIQECNNIVLTTTVEGGAEALRGTIATRIQNTLGVEK